MWTVWKDGGKGLRFVSKLGLWQNFGPWPLKSPALNVVEGLWQQVGLEEITCWNEPTKHTYCCCWSVTRSLEDNSKALALSPVLNSISSAEVNSMLLCSPVHIHNRYMHKWTGLNVKAHLTNTPSPVGGAVSGDSAIFRWNLTEKWVTGFGLLGFTVPSLFLFTLRFLSAHIITMTKCLPRNDRQRALKITLLTKTRIWLQHREKQSICTLRCTGHPLPVDRHPANLTAPKLLPVASHCCITTANILPMCSLHKYYKCIHSVFALWGAVIRDMQQICLWKTWEYVHSDVHFSIEQTEFQQN